MSPTQIAIDVGRGIWIKRQIEQLTDELKKLEKRLEKAGLEGEQIPLQDAEREGKQYLARGTDYIVPVRFESDSLIASFAPDSEKHAELAAIAGDKLPRLFVDTRKFERSEDDGNKFRKLVRSLLAPDKFAAFIQACISRKKDGMPKSKTVIAWNEAKPVLQQSPV